MPGDRFEFDESGDTFLCFLVAFYTIVLIPVTYLLWPSFDNRGMGASVAEIRKAYKKLSLKHHPDRQGDEKQFILVSKAYAALTNEISRKNWEEFGNPDGPRAAHFGIALPKWMIEKDNFYLVIGAYVVLFMLVLPIAVGSWWYNTMRFTNNRVLIDTVRDFCYAFVRSPHMARDRVIVQLSNAHEFEPNHNKEITCRPSDNLEVPLVIQQIPKFTIFKKAIVGSPSSIKARALIYAHLQRLDLPQNTLHLDRQYIIKHCPRLIEEMINSLLYILAYAMEEADSRGKTSQHLATMENCMHLVPMLIQAVDDPTTSLLQLPHIGSTQLRHMSAKQRNIKSVRQLIGLPDDQRRNLFRGLSDENYRDIINVCANMPTLEIDYHCGISGEEDQTIWSLTMVTVTVHLKRLPLLDLSTLGAGAASGGGPSAAVPGQQHYSEAGWNRSSAGGGAAPAVASTSPTGHQQLYPAIDSQAPVDTLYPTDCPDAEQSEGSCPPVQTVCIPLVGGAAQKQTSLLWDRKKKKNLRRGRKQRRQQQQQQQNRTQVASLNSVNDRKSKSTASCVEIFDTSESDADDGESQFGLENQVTTKDSLGSGQLDYDLSSPPELEDINGDKDVGGDVHRPNWSAAGDPKSFARKTVASGTDSGLPHCTHLVHCPYFPVEKFEGWWLYIVDRRMRQLITRPYYLATLQSEEVIPLRFVAPHKPGTYMYTLCVRSDSYVDSDFSETIRFTVKPIPEGVIQLLEKHADHDDDEEDGDDEEFDEEIEEEDEEELGGEDEAEIVDLTGRSDETALSAA